MVPGARPRRGGAEAAEAAEAAALRSVGGRLSWVRSGAPSATLPTLTSAETSSRHSAQPARCDHTRSLAGALAGSPTSAAISAGLRQPALLMPDDDKTVSRRGAARGSPFSPV